MATARRVVRVTGDVGRLATMKPTKTQDTGQARRNKRRNVPQAVKVITVHPLVRLKALELAGGDKDRVVIQSDGSVIVYNQPPKKRTPRRTRR